jgi:glycosyltransferase involved in cell wall biosynthesis
MMAEFLLSGSYREVELQHIRMAFSQEIEDVGRPGLAKIFHLLELVAKIISARLDAKPDVIYYLPAGPNMVPFLRDCILLVATRWMFKRTIFHFQAAGLSDLRDRLPGPLKILFSLAYNRPHLAISLSQHGLRDARAIIAQSSTVIPNGVPDVWAERTPNRNSARPTILFLAMVCEEKGAGILIEACKILQSQGHSFSCKIAGRASSAEELAALQAKAKGLEDILEFTGAVTGESKWKLFAESDIFCFPTFYASESFGIVAIEAMMAGLPVVTSDWRAMPEIVLDGETGYVTPVKNAAATADRLAKLLQDRALREKMGKAGRARFLENYRIEIFRQRMEAALAGTSSS